MIKLKIKSHQFLSIKLQIYASMCQRKQVGVVDGWETAMHNSCFKKSSFLTPNSKKFSLKSKPSLLPGLYLFPVIPRLFMVQRCFILYKLPPSVQGSHFPASHFFTAPTRTSVSQEQFRWSRKVSHGRWGLLGDSKLRLLRCLFSLSHEFIYT